MTDLDTNRVINADAFDALSELPENSVHAVVTDPPYGLAFMGRDWDDFEPKEYQEWCEEWARECKRVLKPGGHLLAFSGNRTHHRLFTGVEDAGFEIRDTLTYHYGSGFPKALDVGKAIDKAAGVDREVVGEHPRPAATENYKVSNARDELDITAPATSEAKKWDGWKTGLKPATEYIVMARKPFDGATVDCVLEHGTGALNIDETRIEGGERPNRNQTVGDTSSKYGQADGYTGEADGTTTEGRYPANVVFDARAAQILDRQSGMSESVRAEMPKKATNSIDYGEYDTGETDVYGYDDRGGASRFFYTSKARKCERTLNGRVENEHPTVKPTDLMIWLVQLVTREGQVVLDPFAGSGTTLLAADFLGRDWIGIERDDEHAELARRRVDGYEPSEVKEWIDDEEVTSAEQQTLKEVESDV